MFLGMCKVMIMLHVACIRLGTTVPNPIVRIMLFANGRGCAPPQTPPLF